jgi:hypothetical protein
LFVCLFPMLVTWSFNRSNGIKVVKKIYHYLCIVIF